MRASDIKPGATVKVWWRPGRDTVTKIRPYDGPLECLQGGWIFEFAINTKGMTVAPNDRLEIVT
jgi:hypothetical protein